MLRTQSSNTLLRYSLLFPLPPFPSCHFLTGIMLSETDANSDNGKPIDQSSLVHWLIRDCDDGSERSKIKLSDLSLSLKLAAEQPKASNKLHGAIAVFEEHYLTKFKARKKFSVRCGWSATVSAKASRYFLSPSSPTL